MATATKNDGKVDIASLIVDVSAVEKTRRGRTANVNVQLRDLLAAVKPGQAALTGAIVGTAMEPGDRSKISQTIRSHWKMVHGDTKCSINWSPKGVAQVSFAQ